VAGSHEGLACGGEDSRFFEEKQVGGIAAESPFPASVMIERGASEPLTLTFESTREIVGLSLGNSPVSYFATRGLSKKR